MSQVKKKTKEVESKAVAVVVSNKVEEKYSAKPTEQMVENVIQEIEDMLVERTKTSREYTMLVFWETGQLLREKEKTFKINITALVSRIATDNRVSGRQMGERNIWFAIKFFDWAPQIGKLQGLPDKVYQTEHGENISLSKVKKMLTTPKPKKEVTVEDVAHKIVANFGVEGARKVIKAIEKEISKTEDRQTRGS